MNMDSSADILSVTIVSATESESATERVASYGRLVDGWHFGSGKAATGIAVLNTILALAELRQVGWPNIESFPDPAGGIVLAAGNKDDSVELLCDREGSFELIVESKGSESIYGPGLSFAKIANLIGQIPCRFSKLSDLSTQPTSTLQGNALQALPLRTQQMAVFPSSMPGASPPAGQQSALTSLGSTQMLVGIRQRIGQFNPRNFRQRVQSTSVPPNLAMYAITT